jgi:hypothetical protein
VCRFHVAAGAESTTRPHKFSGAVAKSASNNLREFVLSHTGRLNFGFITKGKLTVVLFTPSSWGSQLVRQHRRINKFSGAVAGEKEDFCKGVSHFQYFYFVIVLLIFFILFLFASFYQKYKKN